MERRKPDRPEVIYQDSQLVITRTYVPSGLRLVGAVDASNVDGLSKVLATSMSSSTNGDALHLDLTRLEFADVSGIRAVVGAAEGATDGHRMVLHGLPPLMTRVIDVIGWSEMSSLEISHDGFPGHEDPRVEDTLSAADD